MEVLSVLRSFEMEGQSRLGPPGSKGVCLGAGGPGDCGHPIANKGE
jgi:hypothetical protein